MAVILSRNFRIQDLNIDEVLKVETLTKPFTFAEIYLMKRALERWRIFVRSRHLLKQYFNKWKTFQQMSSKEENESTSQKIDTLISELHRMKVKRKKDVRSNSDSAVEVKKIKGNGATEMKKQWKGECFKNRYKTQRDIIITQKTKLDQQSKIIEDLKLGIINDELTKSLETTKTELQKIFGKSPNKLKCKLAPSGIKFEDTLAKFIINSSKAPKFLQQMERRALERARNREIIRERKRLIDEEKRRIFEEAVEQKRRQDEEEKRKNLEAVREKQREELEKQKIIQANKEKFLADLKKANRFYKRKIMRRCFHRLEHNVYIAQNNMLRAESFSEKKSKINSFNSWKNFIIQKYKGPNEKADKLYKKLTLMKSFGCWKNVYYIRFSGTTYLYFF